MYRRGMTSAVILLAHRKKYSKSSACRLSYSHLETILDSGMEFEADFKGTGQIDSLR